jgi:glucosamine--fructose-6-phosphate aminotransferase (isomerizing)
VQGGRESYYMLREISEEPVALRDTLTAVRGTCKEIASELARDSPGLIYFSGSGTSYHAALSSHYLMSSLSKMTTNCIPASEFGSWVRATPASGSVLIVISQSGESVDALSAVRTAKTKGIRTIAVTNTAGCSLSTSADQHILARAGPESAVTATKTFVCCLAAVYLFGLELMDATESFAGSAEQLDALRRELTSSPPIVQETIRKCEARAETLASRFRGVSLFFLFGRGANYATALEGALKLKESSNVMAEGHAAREFLHGPLQLVDESTPVVAISTKNDYESLEPLAESFGRLGAPIVWVSEMEVAANREEQLEVAGGLSEPLSPLAFIVPIQLFAYYSAISRGLDPDKPTRLTKVVR